MWLFKVTDAERTVTFITGLLQAVALQLWGESRRSAGGASVWKTGEKPPRVLTGHKVQFTPVCPVGTRVLAWPDPTPPPPFLAFTVCSLSMRSLLSAVSPQEAFLRPDLFPRKPASVAVAIPGVGKAAGVCKLTLTGPAAPLRDMVRPSTHSRPPAFPSRHAGIGSPDLRPVRFHQGLAVPVWPR